MRGSWVLFRVMFDRLFCVMKFRFGSSGSGVNSRIRENNS